MITHRIFQDALIAANGGNWFDFEGLVRDIYVSILKPGDVALDVGVNRGDHLLQMAPAVAPTGMVIGIEAAPAMLDIVRENLRLSGFAGRYDIVLHGCAVSDHEGVATFHFVKDEPGLSSLAGRDVARSYQTETFECPVTTLDNILRDLNRRVAFAKIDIEGAEYHALLGGKRLLNMHRPPIVFEFDRMSPTHFGYECDDFLALFRSAGYTVTDFFGFRYNSAAELMESNVWNYFAAPSEQIERFGIPELVCIKLGEQGIIVPEH